jgi:hypothetical protein
MSSSRSSTSAFATAKWSQLMEEISSFQTDLQLNFTQCQNFMEPILTTLQQSEPRQDGAMRQSVEQFSEALKAFLQTKQILSNQQYMMTNIQRQLGSSPFVLDSLPV